MAKIKDDAIFDTSGVADLLQVDGATVRRWAKSRRLVGQRLNNGRGSWVFTGKSVREFIELDELERDSSKGGRPRGGK